MKKLDPSPCVSCKFCKRVYVINSLQLAAAHLAACKPARDYLIEHQPATLREIDKAMADVRKGLAIFADMQAKESKDKKGASSEGRGKVPLLRDKAKKENAGDRPHSARSNGRERLH